MAGRDRKFCTVEGCGSAVTAKDLCGLHYERLRRTGTTEKRASQEKVTCVRCGLRNGDYIRSDGRVCKACYQKEKRAAAITPGICANCGEKFEPTRRYSVESGRAMYCSRKCKDIAWRKSGRNAEASLRSYYHRRYGLTEEQVAEMREHGCEICGAVSDGAEGRWGNLHIDHNHETGVVRGVLCTTCNTGLGQFKDNPELLEKAAAYLRGSSS
jgi:hypothetical protein